MMFINLLLYLISFVAIWIGAGLIISSTASFSKRLKLSSFAFSFVFLGLLTSTPEFSVGLQAVADHNAEVFVGNLLGGIPVLFLIVIPLLAIFGRGVSLKHELDHPTLLVTLAVIIAPAVYILDRRVTNYEGVALIILYGIMLYMVERKNGIFDRDNTQLLNMKAYSYKDILKILVGIGIVFVSSDIIVQKTMYFADFFHISAFYISLIVVSLGTNLPELSLAIRSVMTGKKDVAMGDYLGSAAVNTLFFGIFTLLHNGEVITANHFILTFFFIATGLFVFYVISRTKNFITRSDGFILVGIYVLFVVMQFL